MPDNAPGTSDLPYHNAETEAIARDREAETPDGEKSDGEADDQSA